jgi:hypothetical protein
MRKDCQKTLMAKCHNYTLRATKNECITHFGFHNRAAHNDETTTMQNDTTLTSNLTKQRTTRINT